jgi:energy-coupling factor transporter ATP-binding protein EcfA2
VEIMELLTSLNRDQGITVVMVTHEPDMAAYAGRLVRFVDGRIASDPQPGGRLMLYETLKLAAQAIRRNALRSFLTVLGIVIGVGAVIAMVTIGNGTTAKVAAEMPSSAATACSSSRPVRAWPLERRSQAVQRPRRRVLRSSLRGVQGRGARSRR